MFSITYLIKLSANLLEGANPSDTSGWRHFWVDHYIVHAFVVGVTGLRYLTTVMWTVGKINGNESIWSPPHAQGFGADTERGNVLTYGDEPVRQIPDISWKRIRPWKMQAILVKAKVLNQIFPLQFLLRQAFNPLQSSPISTVYSIAFNLIPGGTYFSPLSEHWETSISNPKLFKIKKCICANQ